jgi:hypothetical protein
VGQKFENYVREYLFVDKYYDMIEKTHNYLENSKDFVEASMKPDFKLRDRWTKQEFYLEAKFRTGLYKEKIVWCNDKQLLRYQEFNRKAPVFVIIGMGEDPKYPEFLSLIPLSAAKYTGLFPSFAERYEIKLDEPVTSKIVWSR